MTTITWRWLILGWFVATHYDFWFLVRPLQARQNMVVSYLHVSTYTSHIAFFQCRIGVAISGMNPWPPVGPCGPWQYPLPKAQDPFSAQQWAALSRSQREISWGWTRSIFEAYPPKTKIPTRTPLHMAIHMRKRCTHGNWCRNILQVAQRGHW